MRFGLTSVPYISKASASMFPSPFPALCAISLLNCQNHSIPTHHKQAGARRQTSAIYPRGDVLSSRQNLHHYRKEDIVRYRVFVILGLLIVFILAGVLLPVGYFLSAKAAGQLAPRYVGGIPPLLSVSHRLGLDQSNRTLRMSAGLAMRNQDQLNALLHNLYNPSSPAYHRFLTVDQFAQQFAPTGEQQQAVINYLTQQGFTITQTYPNHLLIDFSGSESLAEQVFNVKVYDYQGPGGRHFFANANVPTLPAYLASYVTYLGGLDDANQFYHPPIVAQQIPATNPHAGSNCPAPGQSGGGGLPGSTSQVAYIPSQFAKAYNYDRLHNAGLQGEGQTVGVFELDGYSQSDVQAYTQCFGGGNVPIQNVILDGFNGQPGAGAIEVELDMEIILSMAPKLAKMIVYEAPNTTQGYNDEFARIVSDRTPVISVSWGDCEKNMGQQEAGQENKFFQEAAAQGQTRLANRPRCAKLVLERYARDSRCLARRRSRHRLSHVLHGRQHMQRQRRHHRRNKRRLDHHWRYIGCRPHVGCHDRPCQRAGCKTRQKPAGFPEPRPLQDWQWVRLSPRLPRPHSPERFQHAFEQR